MIIVLTGGTGGAKLVEGLATELDPAELTLICNTGDDWVFHGLHISPDIDTIIYTLAGLSDTEKGWGIQGDSFVALEQLRRLGMEAWFHLGDKDLATHITRTQWLREGRSLSEITDHLRRLLGVRSTILPMSDESVKTFVMTPQGEMSFQEFFVKEHWRPTVSAVRFEGADQCRPAPRVIEAIRRAEGIVICPSNPITSIGPILAVPGIRAALQAASTPVIGVSPLVRAVAISGPAHKLMIASGVESSVLGVARCYADFLDTFMIANEDRGLIPELKKLSVNTVASDIRMPDRPARRRVARELLALIRK